MRLLKKWQQQDWNKRGDQTPPIFILNMYVHYKVWPDSKNVFYFAAGSSARSFRHEEATAEFGKFKSGRRHGFGTKGLTAI